jgi:hypothetical protein
MSSYEVSLVNPKTSEERKIIATIPMDQVVTADASPCFQSFIHNIVRAEIPAGFMPLGNGVKPIILQ